MINNKNRVLTKITLVGKLQDVNLVNIVSMMEKI